MSLRHRLALRLLLRGLDTGRETEWMAAHIRGWHHVTPPAEHTDASYLQLARNLLAGLAAHANRH
ncbi:hypothetical protein [Streptomyces scabiei]|uniref:Uncharacterized protein n=1 Tax=Streptomyces scabiei TaxID=1930 RepID=A0A100JQY0_STRSC|nr:hypothetical protein [Streptomyces scabiei]GAQ64067.1 hypothetical protein SsS58_04457 [Streptomyces scabiei]